MSEEVANRLLSASARFSYDPLTAIDWSKDIEEGRYATPPERISLYGTSLWRSLSDEQRKQLSRLEVASAAATGIWFEAVLMQMLIKYVYVRDPLTSHVQYAYTEVADECRHSVMFAKLIEKLGSPLFGPNRIIRFLGKVQKSVSDAQLLFAVAMFVEEFLDQKQREESADDRIEPLVRAVAKLHVTEEARHIAYARAEVLHSRMRPTNRFLLAVIVYVASTHLIHPGCYKEVGLNSKQAARAARNNPHWRESRAWFARKVVSAFIEAGMIGGPGKFFWRKAGLL